MMPGKSLPVSPWPDRLWRFGRRSSDLCQVVHATDETQKTLWNININEAGGAVAHANKKEKKMRIFVLCLFATYLGTAALATGL